MSEVLGGITIRKEKSAAIFAGLSGLVCVRSCRDLDEGDVFRVGVGVEVKKGEFWRQALAPTPAALPTLSLMLMLFDILGGALFQRHALLLACHPAYV